MAKIEEVAAVAWDETKEKTDPAFADVQLDFQQKLVTHAQTVQDHGLKGNENPSAFEKKVEELLKSPEKVEAAVKKARVATAQAQADAFTTKAKELAAEAKAK
jgi:hypothetical protein